MNKTARAFVACLKPTEYYNVKVERINKTVKEHPYMKGETYTTTTKTEVSNGVIWTNEDLHAFERGMRENFIRQYRKQHNDYPFTLDILEYTGNPDTGKPYITYDGTYAITVSHIWKK